MLPSTHRLAVLATALLSGTAAAQLGKGASAPEFTIEKAWNDGPQGFADLAGKLVILDFAQTW